MWYAVYTGPRREGNASAYLSTAGVEVVCPSVLQTSRVRRSGGFVLRTARMPAFPCYLFAKAKPLLFSLVRDPPDRVGRLKVIRSGEVPCPIDDCVVDSLRDLGDYVDLHELKVGAKVSVGSLAGLVAVISRVTDLVERHEVSVWIEMLGVKKEISVPAATLAAV